MMDNIKTYLKNRKRGLGMRYFSSEYWQVAGSCEYGNKYPVLIKYVEFHD